TILRKDGGRTPIEVRTFPITLGGQTAVLGVARDLTERRLLDERLRELSLAVEQSPTSILITDLSGKIEYVNPRLCQLTGYTREELIGRNPRVFNAGTTTPELFREMWETIRGGKEWRGEFQNRKKSGECFWESAVIAPLRNSDGEIAHFVAVKEDITERKKTEAALRESEESYRRLFELSPDAIFIQSDGRFSFVNPAALKLFGASEPVQLVGRPIMDRIHPDYRQIVSERIASINREQHPLPTLREVYVRLDGSSVDVEVATAPLLMKGKPSALVIVRDLSERTSLEKQLLRAQRLDSIGTLAAGIAHDLNNILAPIMMSAQMLQLVRPHGDEAEMIATIQESARRGADIVKQVLTFARGVEGNRISVQVRHLVREIYKLAQETFPKAITLETDLPRDLWPVTAEPTQLHQVLLNLCVNARDAMPEGGTLRISTCNILTPDNKGGLFAEGKPGPHVLIRVSDTGQGIPENILDKIFEPFFTTKEQGKGTGLGLSTVLGIVRSHGGFVDVESRPGQGSTFKVYIPADPGKTVTPSESSVPSLRQGQGECVLVVDDEAAIRSVTQRTLSQNGYRVLTATNGREALAIIAAHRGQISVVVTDIMMPVMDGVALIEALQQSSKLPVIACTGWGQQGIRAKLQALGVDLFLDKPYPAASLLTLLPQALRRRPDPADRNKRP
ncbi:MAG TPA: PAS domain S-box protein, partial [Verrucomicrobiae bacterium]|nr:PAS domain S-box protein [Verrucomicrobiae bacterium]